ncbi:zinc finger MYM-type protein 1-like, partial [Aphis craccivora]
MLSCIYAIFPTEVILRQFKMSQQNAISLLIKIDFSLLSLEQKIKIKNEGRPKPNIIIVKESKCKDRIIKRSFNIETYEKNDWICGCDVTNSRSNEISWSKLGIDDLCHLSAKIKSHEKTQSHINAQLSLKLLGKQDIRQQLNSAFLKENRYILSKIIDCIRFCGAFELALRGHDEKADSINPGVFRRLINFSAELDSALKTHLEKTTVFKGISKEIQNDILDCTLTVCQNQIKIEINEADFISIIADETTDVSNFFQMSIVFRYVLTDGSPVERFWGFFNPTGHDAKCLSECIKSTLQNVLLDKQKLITQSYDGANVMSGHISGVQTLIKSDYPNAHYVHCYAHQLILIMKAASSKSKETRIFFSNLTDITNIFRVLLKELMPNTVETRWNFKSRVVNTGILIEFMDKIEATSNQTITINQAGAVCRMLLESTFIYWLNVFHRIMPQVDIIYNQLQKRSTSPVEINNAIHNIEINIKKERDNLDNIQIDEGESAAKKRRENMYLTRNIVAKE